MVKKIFPFLYRLRLLFLTMFLIVFTSCIEIVETITINENLSGSIKYSVETSELASIFNNFSGFLEEGYEKDLEKVINKYVAVLDHEDGISNVNYIIDKRKGNYGFSFDFENSKKLNIALYNISGNKKGFFSPSYLKLSKKKLKKLNISPWVKKYLERENIEIPESSLTNMIDFKSVYKLPGKINSTSNSRAKIKENKQSAVTNYSLTDIIENKVNSGIRIRFKTNR